MEGGERIADASLWKIRKASFQRTIFYQEKSSTEQIIHNTHKNVSRPQYLNKTLIHPYQILLSLQFLVINPK